MSLAKTLKEAFNFGSKRLRVFGTIDEPWFCGKDVASILDYKDPTKAIRDHVKDRYKMIFSKLYKNLGEPNQPHLNKYEKGMIYIREAGLYTLIIKSSLPDAERFQDWVFEEVLPSIRKNGYYVNSDIDSKKLERLQNQVDQLQSENKEKDDQLNRLHNIQKELLSYKKRITKEEIVYIVSTANYARQGIFKIDRTKNQMKFRSSSHNTIHIQGDKVKIIRAFNVNDCILVERNIHTKLKGLALEGETEFFMCPYDLLESMVDLIVHNDDQENDMVNRIIDTVFKLKQQAFKSIDWVNGIPAEVLQEKIIILDEDGLIQLDVTEWTEENKKEFVVKCLKNYIEVNNKVKDAIQWKDFHPFLAKQLSIPKTKFKLSNWKPIVKNSAKEEKLMIRWRSSN